jgi:hypothetical protein
MWPYPDKYKFSSRLRIYIGVSGNFNVLHFNVLINVFDTLLLLYYRFHIFPIRIKKQFRIFNFNYIS